MPGKTRDESLKQIIRMRRKAGYGSAFRLLGAVLLLFVCCVRMEGGSPTAGTSPKEWAEEAAAKEIEMVTHPGSYLRYKQRTMNNRGDESRDVIESRDGSVARLVMRDNRPLTAEEDKAERDRLNALLASPGDFARHVRNDQSEKKTATDLIKLMPDAMIYTFAADQTPANGSGGPQVVLDYAPDPRFNPPTTISAAFSGLRGRAWIDVRTKTIVRMNGEVFQGVNVGWGMLAHLYPGGTVEVEQTEAGGARWHVSQFHQHVTVKALMVKTIKVDSEVESREFRQLPGAMSYQDAIRLLLSTPLPKG